MYAIVVDGVVESYTSRPRWFDIDGQPVSDEILISEGYYPLEDNFPDVDLIENFVRERPMNEWIVGEDKVTKTYVVELLSKEQQRRRYPRLSMVDFRKKLRAIRTDTITEGIYEEDILDKVSLIPDRELAAEARDYFLYAQYIERINPWIDILGAMFDLTPEQIDESWLTE